MGEITTGRLGFVGACSHCLRTALAGIRTTDDDDRLAETRRTRQARGSSFSFAGALLAGSMAVASGSQRLRDALANIPLTEEDRLPGGDRAGQAALRRRLALASPAVAAGLLTGAITASPAVAQGPSDSAREEEEEGEAGQAETAEREAAEAEARAAAAQAGAQPSTEPGQSPSDVAREEMESETPPPPPPPPPYVGELVLGAGRGLGGEVGLSFDENGDLQFTVMGPFYWGGKAGFEVRPAREPGLVPEWKFQGGYGPVAAEYVQQLQLVDGQYLAPSWKLQGPVWREGPGLGGGQSGGELRGNVQQRLPGYSVPGLVPLPEDVRNQVPDQWRDMAGNTSFGGAAGLRYTSPPIPLSDVLEFVDALQNLFGVGTDPSPSDVARREMESAQPSAWESPIEDMNGPVLVDPGLYEYDVPAEPAPEDDFEDEAPEDDFEDEAPEDDVDDEEPEDDFEDEAPEDDFEDEAPEEDFEDEAPEDDFEDEEPEDDFEDEEPEEDVEDEEPEDEAPEPAPESAPPPPPAPAPEPEPESEPPPEPAPEPVPVPEADPAPAPESQAPPEPAPEHDTTWAYEHAELYGWTDHRA